MFRNKDAKRLLDSEVTNLTKQGKYEEVLSIIRGYPIKKLIDNDGNHLLHLATKYNNIEVMKFLIKTGCDITAKDASRMTPLTIALLHKNFEAAKALHEAQVESLRGRSRTVTLDDSWSFSGEGWRDESEIPLYNDLVSNMRKKRLSSEQIGEALAKVTNCLLSDVYHYRDPVMTKAYLQSITRTNTVMLLHGSHGAVKNHDLQHMLLMLDNAPVNRDRILERFCSDIVRSIDDFRKTRSGRKLLKKFFSLELFSEENLEHLEWQFFNERVYNLKVFYDFHSIVKARYGRDIFASLWGNGYSSITSLLRDDQIDLNGRGHDGKTPLHFVAERGFLIKNVQLLLERGADPNALDKKLRTPLGSAIFNRWDNVDETCIKMLLLAGGNPLLISSDHLDDMLSSLGYLPSFRHCASIKRLVFAQLIIYETLGQSIEKSMSVFEPWFNEELEMFIEECREQLIKLKKNEVRENCGLSMYTILTERPEKNARFLSQEDVRTILKFAERNEKALISYYYDLLKKRAEDIAQINCYRSKAVDVVCQFTGISDPHHLVVNKIVGYFSIKDLRKFTIVDVSQEKSSAKTEAKNWLKRAKQRICQF